jgi:hypothetical protein
MKRPEYQGIKGISLKVSIIVDVFFVLSIVIFSYIELGSTEKSVEITDGGEVIKKAVFLTERRAGLFAESS